MLDTEVEFETLDTMIGALLGTRKSRLASPVALARAAMLMFVLSEVHPFDDGNGRIARAFMNAELISGGQRRILIPTAFREDYLTGLRTLSRQRHPNAYLQILDYAQEYTWRIGFSAYDAALETLTETGAFAEGEVRGTLAEPGEDARVEPRLRLPRSSLRRGE